MPKRRNKNNNGGGQNRPQQYTGKNKDPMGDSGRMERYAIDMFRDMSRGKFDLSNVYKFQNRDFAYAAIRAAEKNFRRHDIMKTALNFAYGRSDDVDVIALTNIEISTCNGWQYIINTLYAFMQTGDLGMLAGMAQQLANNRNLRL